MPDPFEGRAAKKREMDALRRRRQGELSGAPAPSRAPQAAPRERPPDPRFEGRAAKEAEAKALRERRAQELQRAKDAEMRLYGLPKELRDRFDMQRWGGERSLDSKLKDVLGEAPAPAREKRRR